MDPPGAAASPQAKAEPTPLASPSSLGPLGASADPRSTSDAGPAPVPLEPDTDLAADVLREPVREPGGKEGSREAHEVAGLSLQASLRTGEAPGPPKMGEVNAGSIDAARHRIEDRLVVELSATRAHFEIAGAFPLPPGTELRSRTDRYGHLLLWPNEETYRVVQPGALRALLGERRLDVAPLSPAEVRQDGDGPHRLNLRTRRVEIATRAAKATIDLAAIRDLGEGGDLVCRFLLDLMSAASSTQVCDVDEVPLHAELRWTRAGTLTYDVSTLTPRTDLPVQDLTAPPPGRTLSTERLPVQPAEPLLQKAEMAAFRTAPIEVASAAGRDAQALPADAGLLLVNSSDELRVAWLDGVPLAWVAPAERIMLPALVHGRYELQWRTVLGDNWAAPDVVMVPGWSEAK